LVFFVEGVVCHVAVAYGMQAALDGEAPGSGDLKLDSGQLDEYKQLKQEAATKTSKLVGDRDTEEAPYKVRGCAAGASGADGGGGKRGWGGAV
jgi:hypothetical protein